MDALALAGIEIPILRTAQLDAGENLKSREAMGPTSGLTHGLAFA